MLFVVLHRISRRSLTKKGGEKKTKQPTFKRRLKRRLWRWRTNLQLSISSIDPSAFRLVSFVIFAPSEATQSTKVTWTSFIVVFSSSFSVVVSLFDDDVDDSFAPRRTLFFCSWRPTRDRWWWWCFENWMTTLPFIIEATTFPVGFRCSRRRRGGRRRRRLKEEEDEDVIRVIISSFSKRAIYYYSYEEEEQ